MTERARIRRGTQPRQKQRQTAPVRRGTAKRKAGNSRALVRIPLPLERLKDFVRKSVAVLIGAGLVFGLWFAHVPQFIGTQLGEAVGAAGFRVKTVDIQGIHHMDRLPVYAVALDQKSKAMPLVDLKEVRQKLLQFGWVADARVSRRLPDTLLIDVVEREPAAIWQYQGRLAQIDKDGHVLSAVDPRSMSDLQVLVGENANAHVAGLAAIEASAPRLKPMIAGATWVGDRRWDIRFQSGQILSLPEGDDMAKSAFMLFDQQDQNQPLLGQRYTHFDMRLFDLHKFVIRLSREPGYQVGDAPTGTPTHPAPAGTDAI